MKNDLGSLEYKIMKIVWKQKNTTVQYVVEKLNKEKKLAYTTVMTVMARLAKKGVLEREKRGKVYFYKSSKTKQQFIHSLIRNTISNFIDKFGEEATMALVDEASLLSSKDKKNIVTKLENLS